ncbi:hypothetical protein FRB91_005857 [Serendipita sp. 411]|nr:hypothetical protein FRC15_008877 [Serendipita sp. 397]KAG8820726.1 hypothetical protein FRC19_008649 [Serendipita sp. 401]KAG8852853.1 hypothetical protein FRB91_005857 [Serendipita sp. 411]KAG9053791.1 hypothetical protein FS842_007142 [Serendipita sp. 407]
MPLEEPKETLPYLGLRLLPTPRHLCAAIILALGGLHLPQMNKPHQRSLQAPPPLLQSFMSAAPIVTEDLQSTSPISRLHRGFYGCGIQGANKQVVFPASESGLLNPNNPHSLPPNPP